MGLEKSTDEQLYNDYVQNGSEAALQILVERYQENLTFFLQGIVKNREDAEDLMAETFAQLLARDKRFRGESTFKTYLFAIGRNQAYKLLRKKNIYMTESDAFIVGEGMDWKPLPESVCINQEQKKQLYYGMCQLKKDYRDALLLTYFEEMSYHQAAAVMHKTTKQITNLVYRGKQALKQLLEEAGYSYE